MPGAAEADLHRLRLRNRLIFAIRSWFQQHDFIEVETPVRVAAPPPEIHIDPFHSQDAFLRPSPELHLKRLLVNGADRIYELGPCFRRGERGPQHNPEYTMLEWYRTGTDYSGVLEDCRQLLRAVLPASFTYRGHTIDVTREWHVISVSDAYREHAGWDPVADFDADRFDIDFVEKVQPALTGGTPVVLKDYPVEASALARCTATRPAHAERWELLLGGVEIANAYSELCDPQEQRARFESWNRARARAGREVLPLDEAFLHALAQGLPPCGGIALGVDRLLLLLLDAGDIGEVRAFCAP